MKKRVSKRDLKQMLEEKEREISALKAETEYKQRAFEKALDATGQIVYTAAHVAARGMANPLWGVKPLVAIVFIVFALWVVGDHPFMKNIIGTPTTTPHEAALEKNLEVALKDFRDSLATPGCSYSYTISREGLIRATRAAYAMEVIGPEVWVQIQTSITSWNQYKGCSGIWFKDLYSS